MGYRTIKRALGETNLERKCRILFGLCLAFLIAAAFIWVEKKAESVVLEATQTEGRNAVANLLLRTHWDEWDTQEDDEEQEHRELLQDMMDDFTGAWKYESETLALDDMPLTFLDSRIPDDPVEKQKLELVRARYSEALAKVGEDGYAAYVDEDETRRAESQRPLPDLGEYHYYAPIVWTKRCVSCHRPLVGTGSVAQAGGYSGLGERPFRAVKIIIPYAAARKAIHSARAGLWTVGILTVSLAMIALYVVVRYVIVKPLKHLRDVSEEISLGNTELRAEINTHDEFEELAHAFNRMLRHMREAQGELRDVNQSLDAKVDELAQLNMRLYDMNRLKSDFLANMSHELRTPLNSIIGFSEVLGSITSLNEKQRRYAQNIQKSGRLLLDMINDILDLAKLEAGKMEMRPSEFDISVIVRAQCDMVRPLMEEKNIDLNVVATDDLPLIYQDQSKIQQILTNLLSNAIKFTPEGGRITVAISKTRHDCLELTVEDTGIGIPEEDREVIFEKFRQSTAVLDNDGLTREYSGTGLGLSIVREMCKLLGGEISFESQLGVGSTFKVQLPWNLAERPKFNSDLSDKIDALTKPDSGLRPKDIAQAAS
jgi:signal transduction histidine kinase